MEDNFCYNLSLEQYAQLCNRSLSAFKRDFSKVFNTTPGKWIATRRLEHANMLLRSSEKSVGEVAFESGFENLRISTNLSVSILVLHRLLWKWRKGKNISGRFSTIIWTYKKNIARRGPATFVGINFKTLNHDPRNKYCFSGSIPMNYEKYLGPLFFEPFAKTFLTASRNFSLLPFLNLPAVQADWQSICLFAISPGGRIVATDINPAMLEYAKHSFCVTWKVLTGKW